MLRKCITNAFMGLGTVTWVLGGVLLLSVPGQSVKTRQTGDAAGLALTVHGLLSVVFPIGGSLLLCGWMLGGSQLPSVDRRTTRIVRSLGITGLIGTGLLMVGHSLWLGTMLRLSPLDLLLQGLLLLLPEVTFAALAFMVSLRLRQERL